MNGGPIGTHQRSFKRYHPRTPTVSSSPRSGVRNSTPKLQSLLSQKRVKLYRIQIWPVNSEGPFEQKPIKNFGEEAARAYPGTAEIF